MEDNLTVEEGTTVVLDENPPAELAGNLHRVRIRTLNDLVELGAVSSHEKLNQLLDSAKEVTATTLKRRDTFVPFVPVHGTTRPDLRRFGSFVAAAPDASSSEGIMFWRTVRGINPHEIATIDPSTHLTADLYPWSRYRPIFLYRLQNITVERGAVMTIGAKVQSLRCYDLLIKKTGRIVVKGSGTVIKAHSVKGEQ